MNARILIVEDQFIEANNLRIILRKAGYHVCSLAASVAEAVNITNKEKPNLVLLDIQLQGKQTGIDFAKILLAEGIAFIYLSANSSKLILNAAKETKPYGFLTKPFREKDVLVALDIAWYIHQQKMENLLDKKKAEAIFPENAFKEIIGTSASMKAVIKNIKVVGTSDISVLILGESGTGKELVAKCIHGISTRKNKPFIVVNCAALPANLIESELFGHEKGSFTGAFDKRIGKFEQAHEGTIFLDEIGELPQDLQVKLLRVLQEREIEPIGGKKRKIDVRILAATNRDLDEEVAAFRFRLDLYYRLNVFPISLPSLRERKDDIPLLAEHFLSLYSKKENKHGLKLADNILESLSNYSWPGNIRELENVMARSVLLTTNGTVTMVHLPLSHKNGIQKLTSGTNRSITENERDYILSVIDRCNGRLDGADGAAKIMDINVSTLRSRMKKLGIEKKKYN